MELDKRNQGNTYRLYNELDLNLKMSNEGEWGICTMKAFGTTTNSYLQKGKCWWATAAICDLFNFKYFNQN